MNKIQVDDGDSAAEPTFGLDHFSWILSLVAAQAADLAVSEPMAAEVMPTVCSAWAAGTANLVEAHRLWKVQRLDEAVATIAINFSSLTAVQRGTLLWALDVALAQTASTDTRSERDKAVGRVRSQWPTVWK